MEFVFFGSREWIKWTQWWRGWWGNAPRIFGLEPPVLLCEINEDDVHDMDADAYSVVTGWAPDDAVVNQRRRQLTLRPIQMYCRLCQSYHPHWKTVVIVVFVVWPTAGHHQAAEHSAMTSASDSHHRRITDRQRVRQRRVIKSLVSRHCFHVHSVCPAIINRKRKHHCLHHS